MRTPKGAVEVVRQVKRVHLTIGNAQLAKALPGIEVGIAAGQAAAALPDGFVPFAVHVWGRPPRRRRKS